MKHPDFFIIGAPKCGTTTLYSWLKDHPDIFMPEQKEPHYFAPHLSDRYCRVRNEADYLKLFSDAKEHQICGESSVLYSFYPQSIKRILTFNKNAKIIYMIRNPVDMVISYHRQLINNMEEDINNFEKAWDMQEERKQNNNVPKTSQDPDLLQYKTHCSIGLQLQEIMNIVPSNQLLISTLDDLSSNPGLTYNKILGFLNISDSYKPLFQTQNEAFTVQSKTLQKIISNQSPSIKLLKPLLKKIFSAKLIHKYNRKKINKKPIDKQLKQKLYNEFKQDIVLIENLLSRQFPSWTKQD